eukprot:m.137309 g.137309  ORF g.137309 m.137309 type:complete len:564 (+) comp14750_c0_seq5:173-1864(+)
MARCLVWFRKGLRVHDNPALLEGINHVTASGEGMLQPVFILDPWFLKPESVGPNRMRFLLETLQDLDSQLRHHGSNLLILHGKPIEVLQKAVSAWGISHVVWEDDIEPYARKRDAEVTETLTNAGIKCEAPSGHTLYNMKEMLKKCKGGKAPVTYTEFQKVMKAMGAPPKPVDMPERFPPSLDVTTIDLGKVSTGSGIPTLKDLGYPTLSENEGFPARGGEGEALRRLYRQLKRVNWVATFEKPKTDPTQRFYALVSRSSEEKKNPFTIAAAKKGEYADKKSEDSLMTPSTTALSPYLKFGCLSPRLFYHELKKTYSSAGKHSQPPVSLEGQLLWREFYYLVASATPNFDKMEGNPICRQIPWNHDKELLAAWENGKTGYPWIDAAMTQLRKEGWIHHLARHAVACFLTRGDLFVHWEYGRNVFDRDLVDADWALNNGNWMWLSCSCFFYQYFRVYGPHSFAKKYDKEGNYVKHFLPVLKKMPAKYIYEPWTAPLEIQRKAGCIIGKDYPNPIVEHASASKACIEKIAHAYNAHKAATGGESKATKKSKKEKGSKPPSKKRKV